MRPSDPSPATHLNPARWSAVAVVVLTALGLALRLANFGESLLGDELSTYWILNGAGLGDVLSSISSDDEITPPLYFVLAWLAMKIGPDPEWVRLPSLIAGTATIPLIYLLGVRTVNRSAGLVGTAVFALSPFMVYYSTEARAYAVMMFLVTVSTLALLAAVRSNQTRWWALYAVCSAGAMLSHYTALFPLAAQLVWVLLLHREAVRSLAIANVGAVLIFSPWIPGFIADNESPTTAILAALSPFTAEFVWRSVKSWAIGYPYVTLDVAPGQVASLSLAGGLAVAVAVGVGRGVAWSRNAGLTLRQTLHRIPSSVVLVVLLAVAAPLGQIAYSALGNDILAARNLNSSWPGLAVAMGALLTSAGPLLGAACTAVVIAGFGIGAARTLDVDTARINAMEAAELIEARSRPSDVVVDTYVLTPVPLTPLDVYLPGTHPEFRFGLPESDRPFTVFDRAPASGRLARRALAAADGRPIFLVAPLSASKLLDLGGRAAEDRERLSPDADLFLKTARPRFRVTYAETFDGVVPLGVLQLEDRSESNDAG